MTTEDDVRAASDRFYAALNRMLNGDAGAMGDIWARDASVTAMHPIGGRDVGWDAVRTSWERVAQLSTDGRVRLDDRFIQISGDLAYELGVERGTFSLAGRPVTVDGRVTNIYRRDRGAWKIVHHHADISAAMIEALAGITG